MLNNEYSAYNMSERITVGVGAFYSYKKVENKMKTL